MYGSCVYTFLPVSSCLVKKKVNCMSYNFIVLLLIRTTKLCGEYVSLFTHSQMTNQSVNRLMLIA